MSISVSDGNEKYHLSFNEELNNLEFRCVEDEDEDEEKKISINLTNILNVKLMKFEMEEIIRNQNLNQEINNKINKFQLTPVIFKIFLKNDNKLDNLTLISDNKSWSKFSILNNKIDNLFNQNQKNQQPINIILNPNAGQNNNNNLFISIIKPILISAQIQFNLFITKGVDDAGSIGRQILASKPGTRKTIIILGGDGTIHELLNGIILTSTSKSIIVDLIIIPLGTANALYYSLFPPESPSTPKTTPNALLYSLLAFLDRTKSTATPLPLAINTLPSAPHQVITSVVSSAALHSNILLDSEALRSTIPGVERFKQAAMANGGNWWNGKLILIPESGKRHIEIYDSSTQSFKSIETSTTHYTINESTSSTELQGPFVYLASTLVSRFEDTFVIAPFRSPSSSLPPSTTNHGSMDVILIRPLRHQATKAMFNAATGNKKKEGEVKATYSSIVWDVMKGMYNAGSHVDLKYLSFEAHPLSIVEYLRVGGMTWEPDSSDDIKDNVVCFDGTLRDLGNGGKLETSPLSAKSSGVSVWC